MTATAPAPLTSANNLADYKNPSTSTRLIFWINSESSSGDSFIPLLIQLVTTAALPIIENRNIRSSHVVSTARLALRHASSSVSWHKSKID